MAIRIKFIRNESARDVDIIVRAREQNAEVKQILEKLGALTEVEPSSYINEDDPIDLADVIIISKVGRLLSVRTVNGEYVLHQPLYKIEERLSPDRFVKISQSEIVNLRYVDRWSFEGGGIIRIDLEGGISSYTSRRYAVQIRQVLCKRGNKQ